MEHYADAVRKLYGVVAKERPAPTSVMLRWIDPNALTQPSFTDLSNLHAQQKSGLEARSQVLLKIGRGNELLKEVEDVEDQLRTREVCENAFLFVYNTAVRTYSISLILLIAIFPHQFYFH